MTDAPGKHCKNRLFEWTMTAALLGMGLLQIIWPRAVEVSKFQFMLDVIGSGTLAMFCLMIGWFRGLALYLNGGWPVWGARIRMLAAIGGALIFLQMAISIILLQLAINGPPSPSVPLYLALVLAELRSTYRAAVDARFR